MHRVTRVYDTYNERSRSVIRAASLRLLPEVRARSIYQMFSLGPCSHV